jgi:hypothetical protein
VDGAVITHGELHDIFLNRPAGCNGVNLELVEAGLSYGLSIISRTDAAPYAERLRRRIEDLTVDGTLLRLVKRHPPLSVSGAVQLQENVRHHYQLRMWVSSFCTLLAMVAFLGWFLWDRERDLRRTRNSERQLRELNLELKASFAEQKVLRGLLPTCAYCKCVRDHDGQWHQLEWYITKNSEATFSHGICPKCAPQAFAALEHESGRTGVGHSSTDMSSCFTS